MNGSTAFSIQAADGSVRAKTGRDEEEVLKIKNTPKWNLFLGITEEWVQDREIYIFKELRLRFYVHRVTDERIGPPLVRLEWEDEDVQPNIGFHGKGAGHPHWHFGSDVENDANRYDEAGDNITADALADELGRDESNDDALLDDLGSQSAGVVDGKVDTTVVIDPLSLKRFHFPARANWASTPWNITEDKQGRMSHASSPTCPEELVNWAKSAVTYIANEFYKYGD